MKDLTPQSPPIPLFPTATQVTPDPLDSQKSEPDISDNDRLFTQDSRTRLFLDKSTNNSDSSQQSRDYYANLFSSDSEDSNNSVWENHSSTNCTQSREIVLEDLTNLPINIKDELLGHNQPIPKLMSQEISPGNHTDKIGTYNVQNKYDHVSAAELMFNENLTYAAFQEPFHSSNQPVESWQSFTKCELQSSRIDCYQTHHQIVLIDTFHWGGKTLTNFEAYLNGRVTEISFQFGDGKKIGIISIYASSAEVHDNDTQGINKQISCKINHIKEKWENHHTNIDIVILGDFQETCTISDRDNIGQFRKQKLEEGILMKLEDNFESYVRKVQKSKSYVTRFGTNGARGIDHIMLPISDETHNLFQKAYICREQGATYFPSDHSLLVCEYERNDQNNNEDGVDTIKYKYSNLYNIKMKNTGYAGKNISLNDSQFKGSEKFREQAALYAKTQQVTGDTADLTNYHLDPLEARLENLTKSLWRAGLEQQTCGKKNKLVRIDEPQAIEIAHIYKKFMLGVQDVMGTLKLTEERNNLASAGKSRGRVRDGKGFRMFQNLPIPTKLRYLRNKLRSKRRLIEKAQNWLKELCIRQLFDSELMKDKEFWTIRDCIVKTSTIEKYAKNIASKISGEDAERETHLEHINYAKNHSTSHIENKRPREEISSQENKGNCLSGISDSMINLINKWLSEAGCDHTFNMNTSSSAWMDTLTEDISKWKIPLTDFWEEESLANNIDFRHRVQESLEHSICEIKKIENRISLIQVKYKKNTLMYFLKANLIDSFTRKVLHKQRSAPTTHSVIWDDALQTSRPCKNEVEELQATQEHHGKWMGNTEAPENCAFAEIVNEGKLGPRGIKLKSNRKLTMKDIPRLIHNGQKLSRKVKRAFISAHNKYISKLFRYPKQNRKEFFYPFYMTDEKGKMNEELGVEKKLWKSLGSIPGKARHDGFQLATIGRFGARWRQVLSKLIKIMLIMRYIPYEMKKIARFPIPKPGKVNEYRPISLCNDLYCFLNSIITARTSSAIEKTKLLHSGITSYRRGKSCATLVTIEQSFREDCIESNLPSVQLDEDEEKFFDRVCLEIILASMRTNGFPDSGFIELKACMMSEKIVEIITCKGTVFAKFVCGLEQGNPDSPTIANLVIKMKHDVWAMLPQSLRDIIRNDPNGNCHRYKFHVQDRDDGEIWIYMMGYCDDNTKFISAQKEEILIPLVQHYIQLAGDLSMITKIGRKSSKCEIQFYNISAAMTLKLQKLWSTAWSFVHDAPIEEQVPFKVFLQEEELTKFYSLSKYDEMSADSREKWDKIVHPKAHRHLGLTATLGGDTSSSSQATINKMYDRLTKLKVRHMEHASQVKCINMLIATMHSYVPLQTGYSQEELDRLDSSIIATIKRRNGISQSDCKHRIFLPSSVGGLGFVSTLDVDIIATARELEIVSNGQGLDSETFRTRIAAIPNYLHVDEEKIINHARRAILKLARYGLFFRDRRDGIINDILDTIATENNIHAIGNPLYKDGNSPSIGHGKLKNLKCAFGSPLHMLLRHLQRKRWTPDGSEKQFQTKIPCSIERILHIKASAQKRHFLEITAFHSYFEWTNFNRNKISINISLDDKAWKVINLAKELKLKFPSMQDNDWDDQAILVEEIEQISSIKWKNQMFGYSPTTDRAQFNSYSTVGKILNFLELRGSPIIIATDGAHEMKKHHQTSSSFVICSLDIRLHESLASGEWINRPMIPLLARTTVLPQHMGAHASDIAHGEGHAFALQEMALDPNIPRIVITDSVAIRDQILNIRDGWSQEIDRDYVRKKAGGISKYIVGIIKTHMDKLTHENKRPTNITNAQESWICTLRQRNSEFLRLAKQWIMHEDEDQPNNVPQPESVRSWKSSYYDDHPTRPILKVDSHQLERHGRTIKRNPRYDSLVPNLALLSANHHADIGAEIGIRLNKNQKINMETTTNSNFHKPNSNLTFYLTADGHLIDRHVSEFVRNRINIERLQRLQHKPTQGFLWRVFNYVTITWKMLNLHKGFLRSLLGMSNSHSRNIYKSSLYRIGNMQQYLETVKDSETRECIKMASVNEQIQYLLPCPWCKCHAQNSQKGNRRHLLLHCSNEKISRFRTRMNNVVGSQIAALFENLKEKTSACKNLELIHEIEASFLKLQKEQTGRLKHLSQNRNILYIPIVDIIKKLQVHNVEEALRIQPIQFFLNLFHIAPDKMITEPSDEELGVIDSVWLGLMPNNIAHILRKNIITISRNFGDREEGAHWKEEILQDWKQIEAFNMGRAIGIHRIMNEVGNDFEAKLVEKYDLQHVQKGLQEKKRTKRKRSTAQLQKKEQNSQNKKCKKKKEVTPTQEIACNGVTCGLEKVHWCGKSIFSPNFIAINRKQCLRCSLFTTAMKTTANILIDLQQIQPQTQIKLTKMFQAQAKKRNVEFNSLIHMLKISIPSNAQFKRAQYISKSRPTEKWKRICKLLIELATRKTNPILHIDNINPTIQKWTDEIEQTIQFKDMELKHNKVFMDKCVREFQSEWNSPKESPKRNSISSKRNTDIQSKGLSETGDVISSRVPKVELSPPAPQLSVINISSDEEVDVRSVNAEPANHTEKRVDTEKRDPTTMEKEMLLKAKLDLMNRRMYTAGSTMLMAIEVIRNTYQGDNIYVACPEAAQIILNWSPNEGWCRFARIFYSAQVCHRHPNGLYIIPIFSGETTSGHWSVIAIQKVRRHRVAVILDSLGKGSLNSPIVNLISQAFKPNRGRVLWSNPECRNQTGVECGARAICAMYSLAKAFHDNLEFEENVRKATLWSLAEYDQMDIRRSAATHVQGYRDYMRSRAIRLRQWR